MSFAALGSCQRALYPASGCHGPTTSGRPGRLPLPPNQTLFAFPSCDEVCQASRSVLPLALPGARVQHAASSRTKAVRAGGVVGSRAAGGLTGPGSNPLARWLPDLPTFVCPLDLGQEQSSPSDEEWAARGVFINYGKTDLAFADVEHLLKLCDLDISPGDFRHATEVVWAYRLGATAAATATTTAAEGGDAEAGTVRTATGPAFHLVGFASADVVAPGTAAAATAAAVGAVGASRGLPTGVQSAVATAQGAPGRGAGGGGGGRKGRSQRLGRRAPPPAAAADPPPVRGDPGSSGSLATVWFLAVHPDLRRGGLGRALLERLVACVRENHEAIERVTLRSTSRATRFYERVGLVRDPAGQLVRSGPGGR